MSKTLSDSDLDDGLDEAKKKPRYYAIITKGQTIVKMIVQKKRILDGDILSARSEFGGNASITGVCTRNGQELILQVEEKEPALQTIKVKQFITEQTGAALKPQWQVVTEFAFVPDSETGGYGEQIPVKEQKQVGYEEQIPVAKDQRNDQKQVRFDEQTPVKAQKQEIPSQAPSGDYDTFSSSAKVEKQPEKQSQEQPKSPPLFDMTKAKKVKKSLKEVGPKIQQAITVRPQYTDQILSLVSQIKACANNTQQDQGDLALSLFRELVALLAVALQDRGAVAEEKQTSRLVMLQKSRVDWDTARKNLHAQLQDVAAAVKKECQNPDEYDAATVQEGCKKLDIIMEKLDARLIGVLDQALNAKDGAVRGGFEKQAVALINEYLKTVNTDPMVKAVDESGLVAVPIQKSMAKLLGEMAGRLSA
jgi:hypothetical protein